jgi:hypothetical protein
MEEKTVEITVQEYHELLKKAERIDTLKRLLSVKNFIDVEETKALLDIKVAQDG